MNDGISSYGDLSYGFTPVVERRIRPRTPQVTWHRRRGRDGFYLPPPALEDAVHFSTEAHQFGYSISYVPGLRRSLLRLREINVLVYPLSGGPPLAYLQLHLYDTPTDNLSSTSLLFAVADYNDVAVPLIEEVVFSARFPLAPMLRDRPLLELVNMELHATHVGANLGQKLLHDVLDQVKAKIQPLILAIHPNPLQYQRPENPHLLPTPERRQFSHDLEKAQRRLSRHFVFWLGAFPSRRGGTTLIVPVGYGTPHRQRGGWGV